MKKKFYVIYTVLFFGICMLPMILMAFTEQEVVANEIMTEVPSIIEDKKINTEFPEQITEYVDRHFGLRQEMITLNNRIRSSLLGDSGNEKVILGKDGWLFFEETVKDYTGQKLMSDREVFSAAQNLRVLEKAVGEKGGHLYFTVAPNKNSIYGDYMPARYLKGTENNYGRLRPYLQGMDNYVDLFSVLKRQRGASKGSSLYFRLDSHWNNEGALAARNELFDVMQKRGRSYKNAKTERRADHRGDLYDMVYPKGKTFDEEIHFSVKNRFTYNFKVRNNDEPLIETNCKKGEGSLICFRDSFGTALVPFFADEYERAVFSKEVPYNFDSLSPYFPGDVLIELVERNLPQLCSEAPIIAAPECSNQAFENAAAADADFDVTGDEKWWTIKAKIRGSAKDMPNHREKCYLRVDSGAGAKCYEPFYLQNQEYVVRIPVDEMKESPIDVKLYAERTRK